MAKQLFNRILVVRTDRIGDVLLSTPVLKALRENYPHSHIAMMVSTQAKELIEDNPYLDEVITYDKDKKHRGVFGFWKFVLSLKNKRFDLAIILHTKKRTNLITFLANIPKRIGYKDKKFGFLLTDKLQDTRHLGHKHEVDYCLDILRKLGLEVKDRMPYLKVNEKARQWADALLKEAGWTQKDKIAGINPGASCPSKRWMKERFIILANSLVERYGVKIVLVSGKEDAGIAQSIEGQVRYPLLNLAGKTSLSQLAALLERCSIFISNDSGPVHMASSIGVPVVSIFGRNQAGLGPLRWGPLGEHSKYLHKKTGCPVCLAHNCKIGFDCLRSITVDDVLAAADTILR